MANQNKGLGQFQLLDIPPAPRGVPQIEVTFDIDANGIVNVSAKDLGTGKSHNITIKNADGLTEADIEKMIKDAEENAEKDKELKEQVENKNEAEQLIFATQKALVDLGDEVADSEKEEANAAIERLQKAIDASDHSAIKSEKEALNTLVQSLSAKAYEKAQKAQGEGPSEPSDDVNDDVIDADFEEVKQ
jgi:molecular chaperone DnaK